MVHVYIRLNRGDITKRFLSRSDVKILYSSVKRIKNCWLRIRNKTAPQIQWTAAIPLSHVNQMSLVRLCFAAAGRESDRRKQQRYLQVSVVGYVQHYLYQI